MGDVADGPDAVDAPNDSRRAAEYVLGTRLGSFDMRCVHIGTYIFARKGDEVNTPFDLRQLIII
jgi:hypothetical protein